MDTFNLYIAYVSWEGGGKRRPVLLLEKNDEYADVFRITSRFAGKSDAAAARYFEIIDWRQAGLVKQSYIDAVKSVEVPMALISQAPIGKLTERDKQRLLEFLFK